MNGIQNELQEFLDVVAPGAQVKVMTAEEFNDEFPGVLPPGMVAANTDGGKIAVDCENQNCGQGQCAEEQRPAPLAGMLRALRQQSRQLPSPLDQMLMSAAMAMVGGPRIQRPRNILGEKKRAVQHDMANLRQRFPTDAEFLNTHEELMLQSESLEEFNHRVKVFMEESDVYNKGAMDHADNLAADRSVCLDFDPDELKVIKDAFCWWKGVGVMQNIHEATYTQLSEDMEIDETLAFHIATVLEDYMLTTDDLGSRYLSLLISKINEQTDRDL